MKRFGALQMQHPNLTTDFFLANKIKNTEKIRELIANRCKSREKLIGIFEMTNDGAEGGGNELPQNSMTITIEQWNELQSIHAKIEKMQKTIDEMNLANMISFLKPTNF